MSVAIYIVCYRSFAIYIVCYMSVAIYIVCNMSVAIYIVFKRIYGSLSWYQHTWPILIATRDINSGINVVATGLDYRSNYIILIHWLQNRSNHSLSIQWDSPDTMLDVSTTCILRIIITTESMSSIDILYMSQKTPIQVYALAVDAT
jgi:hypothetical protein